MDGNGWSSLGRILAGRKPVFLYRNVRQWRKKAARMMSASMSNSNHPEKGAEYVSFITFTYILSLIPVQSSLCTFCQHLITLCLPLQTDRQRKGTRFCR